MLAQIKAIHFSINHVFSKADNLETFNAKITHLENTHKNHTKN